MLPISGERQRFPVSGKGPHTQCGSGQPGVRQIRQCSALQLRHPAAPRSTPQQRESCTPQHPAAERELHPAAPRSRERVAPRSTPQQRESCTPQHPAAPHSTTQHPAAPRSTTQHPAASRSTAPQRELHPQQRADVLLSCCRAGRNEGRKATRETRFEFDQVYVGVCLCVCVVRG
jgi:hypothetical protein